MGNIILFALLAAVFYYVFKSYSKYEKYSKEAFKEFTLSKDALQKSELGLFVALSAKVAKADGKVDALEAELISHMLDDVSAVFPEPHKTKELLKEIFNEEKNRTDNIEHLAHALAHATKRSAAMQEQFMQFLIQLAFADGEVSKSEEDILATIAEAMNFNPERYHAIFDQYEAMMRNIKPQNTLEDAYKILGVSASDDMATIKKAYRKLVRKYHPDIIKSQGKSADYIKEATQKTQEINAAYEMIKKARG
jgi:DnaJ like chaperone protein